MSRLNIDVRNLLHAFDLAAEFCTSKGSAKQRLHERQQLALGLIDWAVMESDRGVLLLKDKAEGAYYDRDEGSVVSKR